MKCKNWKFWKLVNLKLRVFSLIYKFFILWENKLVRVSRNYIIGWDRLVRWCKSNCLIFGVAASLPTLSKELHLLVNQLANVGIWYISACHSSNYRRKKATVNEWLTTDEKGMHQYSHSNPAPPHPARCFSSPKF